MELYTFLLNNSLKLYPCDSCNSLSSGEDDTKPNKKTTQWKISIFTRNYGIMAMTTII